MKKNKTHVAGLIVVIMALVLTLAGCGNAAPSVDWTLSVSGAVGNPLTLSYEDLTKMEQVDLEDILMEKSLGEDTVGNWSGVPLDTLLAEAGAGSYASITTIAADGYAIEIPLEELEGSIVALKENGEWIASADPDHGPIRMVCPHTPANRWVFQLQEIVVNEQASAGGGIPENAALKITGNVENEIGWAEDKIRSMDTMDAESTNKAGETKTYTGVLLMELVNKAKPNADATTLVLIADDGYSAEVALAEVEACPDCIVSFRNNGGFSSVLPGFPGNTGVKGLVEIQVK